MGDIIEQATKLIAELSKHDAEMSKNWAAVFPGILYADGPDPAGVGDLRLHADAAGAAYLRNAAPEIARILIGLLHDLGTERQRILALQHAYLDETHGDRDPSTVTPDDIADLRAAFREAGEAIRDLVPLAEAADAWRDDPCKGLGSHKEAALADVIDVLRAKRGQL